MASRLNGLAGRLLLGTALVAGLATGAVGAAAPAGATTIDNRVDLRVLVVSDGDSNVTAIRTQLTRAGVPMTVVDTTDATRPLIDDAYLENASAHEGRFQAIVLPGPGTLTDPEMSAIAEYERTYGVREVDAYVYPSASFGLTTPSYSGVLDGSPVTVSPAARSAGFGYLTGSLGIDDFDPGSAEVYGYLADAQNPEPAGESYTSFATATAGGATGSIIGVHTVDGRSQLVISAAFNANQQYFLELAPGIVQWLTRGIHLGLQRNYLAVQVDDVFLADSQWSPVGDCTPGDDCFGVDAGLTTPDIRMQADDVTALTDWQDSHDLKLDMVFNGGGSDDQVSDTNSPDPLLAAFQQHAGEFTWINHTYSHEYLGCIQVAPAVAGQLWHCATPADYADPSTVFIEPDLAQNDAQYDPATGVYYLTQAEIENQISQNLSWAQTHGISTDPTQVVTGEHSGLAILPEQPVDNPQFAPALTAEHIVALAADASRESGSRMVGSARTVPRHPINIFYNVDTYLNEVSEYNWYYTSAEDGGSGICQAQPQITTCITPLPDGSEAQAESSFTGYILPLETRNALSFVLTNDPRPFYVHQSNLTGQRILYPLLNSILSEYRSVYDATSMPLVHLDLDGQAQELDRTSQWNSAMSDVDAYVDATGLHVDGGGTTAAIPVTVPSDAALDGITLSPYGGERSGWIAPPVSDTVVAVPGDPAGGYVGVPDAPVIGPATGGNASATVTWTAPADHGSPVTGYTVRAYIADNPTPSATADAGADATSLTLSGLLNYASYTFTVSATSAAGDSDESARSNAVIPAPSVPGAPVIGTPTAGNATATVSWTAPDDDGSPVTLYTVRLYAGTSTTPSSSQDVAPHTTSATFTGLTNGTAYSFDVFAYNAVGAGPASARSVAVTPGDPLPGAPTLTSAVAGKKQVTLTWSAPADTGASPIRSYTLRAFVADAAQPSATRTVSSTTRRAAVTGLIGGTSYTFDVFATNSAGSGPPSARSAPVTPIDVPAAPVLTAVTPGNHSVTVSWTPPADHGSPITGYRVRVYLGAWPIALRQLSVAGSQTSVVVTRLTNGVGYTFDVRAVNAAGTGPASARSPLVRPVAS